MKLPDRDSIDGAKITVERSLREIDNLVNGAAGPGNPQNLNLMLGCAREAD
jgi:N-acetyl-gamma-glutamylphosphate reductase